jgi:hypothetical protein
MTDEEKKVLFGIDKKVLSLSLSLSPLFLRLFSSINFSPPTSKQ